MPKPHLALLTALLVAFGVSRFSSHLDPYHLDVLTGIDEVPICTGYDVDGVIHREMPMTQTEFHHATPVYEYLDGWSQDISAARSLADLPVAARRYIEFLEQVSGTRISAVGVGQDRDATISIHDLIS